MYDFYINIAVKELRTGLQKYFNHQPIDRSFFYKTRKPAVDIIEQECLSRNWNGGNEKLVRIFDKYVVKFIIKPETAVCSEDVVYALSCKQNLEKFFARIYYVTKVEVYEDYFVTVIVQERIDDDSEYKKEFLLSNFESTESVIKDTLFDKAVLCFLVSNDVSLEMIKKLDKFFKDLKLNDLSESNYRFAKNKELKFIDYSGFTELKYFKISIL